MDELFQKKRGSQRTEFFAALAVIIIITILVEGLTHSSSNKEIRSEVTGSVTAPLDTPCTDSDRNNIFQRGTTEGILDTTSGPQPGRIYDYCTTELYGAQTDIGGYIVEGVCDRGRPFALHQHCPDGYYCGDGICRLITCTDSDHGVNYTKSGVVNVSIPYHNLYQLNDSCYSDTILEEYLCGFSNQSRQTPDIPVTITVDCSHELPRGICRNGVCVSNRTITSPPQPPAPNQCIELDGQLGENPLIPSLVKSVSGSISTRYDDSCIGNTNLLWEYYCIEGNWQQACYRCFACEHGRCTDKNYKKETKQTCINAERGR